ncbi:MAG: hypothetical protein JXR46_12245 [Calditrichaceae bacterium]|nr:hypothetical protein [Calditrichaceae bacterium]MBN2709807.1 hypothetical protein [Calditrichaceae bacterium]
MRVLKKLFEQNRLWAEKVKAEDPSFFTKLARQQKPEYLWIVCSDSRVPANQIIDMQPGQVFVHKNIAIWLSTRTSTAFRSFSVQQIF